MSTNFEAVRVTGTVPEHLFVVANGIPLKPISITVGPAAANLRGGAVGPISASPRFLRWSADRRSPSPAPCGVGAQSSA